MKTKLSLTILLFFSFFIQAQQKSNYKALEEFRKEKEQQYIKDTIALNNYLKQNNLPRVIKTDSSLIVATRINRFGSIEYITTTNVNAAKTSGTNKLHNGGGLGLSLDGTGIVIGEWDGGDVRATHQEFNNTGASRVSLLDNAGTNYHATHVAGTMIGGGVDANAKGMAPNATLISYDFGNDITEMTNEVINNDLKLSNHSYGNVGGWSWNGSAWIWSNGFSSTFGHTEDHFFGFYTGSAADYDNLCYLAPNYTIVKSAGNDNGDGGSTNPNTGGTNYQWPDGPYDCLPWVSNAKNILVVGAANDIPNGYTQPSDVVIASFSSTGPTDDGRIKPDIVANGVSLYSTDNASDTAYRSLSGTSMSAPTVTGSIALLSQHYKNLFGNSNDMSSATIKAILINTADEAGNNPGPDYIHGWGLMNTASAAQKITESNTNALAVKEELLLNGQTYTIQAIVTGTEPVKATVAWTDPAGTPVSDFSMLVDNPQKMLVNDIDFKITNANGTEYFPWQLDVNNPANAATNSAKNDIDNVEGISVGALPVGTVVTLTVNHAGTLTDNQQWFSLVTSGLAINNNDDFANAYEFVPSEFSSALAEYTTTIGTPDGNNYSCTMNTPKNNVWFKFTALSADQSIFVVSDGAYGTLQKPVLSLWNSTGATQLACHQGTTANKAYLNVDNLTVGETYYVSVDNTNTSEAGTFSLFADASGIQTGSNPNLGIEGAGTVMYNSVLNKFQGWNGTQWVDFN